MNRKNRDAAVWLASALFLSLAVPASSTDCPVRGSLKVVSTKFEVGDPILRAKLLPKNRSDLEKRLSEALAGSLRCEEDLRFLEWSAAPAPASRRAGILSASLLRKATGAKTRETTLVLTLFDLNGIPEQIQLALPDALAVLYASKDPEEPGQGGQNWESKLKARFEELARNQSFKNGLVKNFLAVPLVQSDDLLPSKLLPPPAEEVLGLPLNPNHLQAGEGSLLRLQFRLQDVNSPRRDWDLWLSPCHFNSGGWEQRVQCVLEERPNAGKSRWGELARLLSNRKRGHTEIFLQKYVHAYLKTCSSQELP